MIPDEVRTTAAGYANVGKPTEAIRPIGMREQVDMGTVLFSAARPALTKDFWLTNDPNAST